MSILCKGDRPTRGPFFYFVSSNLKRYVQNSEVEETSEWLHENFKHFGRYLRRGLFIENDRTFTAYSPYTQLAAYYYNKYLFQKTWLVRATECSRKMGLLLFRIVNKAKRLLTKR